MTKKVFVTLAALSLVIEPGQAKTATTPFQRAKTKKVPAGRAITLDTTADKDQIADFQKLGAIREPKVGEVLLDEAGAPVQIADSGKAQEVKTAGSSDPTAAQKAQQQAEELANLQARAATLKVSGLKKTATADQLREAIAKREGQIAEEEAKAQAEADKNKTASNTGEQGQHQGGEAGQGNEQSLV